MRLGHDDVTFGNPPTGGDRHDGTEVDAPGRPHMAPQVLPAALAAAAARESFLSDDAWRPLIFRFLEPSLLA